MPHSAIAILTFKSKERIISDGGTQSWKLKATTAEQFDYVVCTRNSVTRTPEGPEPHRSAFLVGKISKIVPSSEKEGRFRICFNEYAEVRLEEVWGHGWRNPVRYTTLEELGIDPAELSFKPIDASAVAAVGKVPTAPEPDDEGEDGHDQDQVGPLTMTQAKEGLSLGLGVPVEAIEIIVKF